MSRLHELLEQAKVSNPALGIELEAEFKRLENRRTFGLVFERHEPEAVELYGRAPRSGDKVHVLPERGSLSKSDNRLWTIKAIKREEPRIANLVETLPGNQEWDTELIGREPDYQSVTIEDVVVVAEHTDPIFPGLVETGRVENGNPDDPAHTVINAENFHAIEALTYTHAGKIDCIYIDPPYNTGARDWKYNNDYVDGEDAYRHSKWLSFMERRLLVAKQLLNPEDSVLIVTIDEKEYLRLGMLLDQTFPEATIQMVSTVIRGQGSSRAQAMSRVDEYIFFAYFGKSCAQETVIETLNSDDSQSQRGSERIWFPLIRGGKSGVRSKSYESFFPVFVDTASGRIRGRGEPLDRHLHPNDYDGEIPEGCTAVWPISKTGIEGRWQMSTPEFDLRFSQGYIRGGSQRAGRWPITYLRQGTIKKVETGEIRSFGFDENGALILENDPDRPRGRTPKTVWYLKSHNAGTYGTDLVEKFIPNRVFPFPKSLYAVEDALRFFVKDKPDATILDFFSGSGTTAHAVMRLNKQDGGRRRSISVTNNEVGADEQKKLRAQGLRPGDQEWEQWGICDYVTKPRIEAAITGKTPEGTPIKGDYKFTDEFPMSDGFKANARFFTLTYENPVAIDFGRGFERIAPLLWFRAGQVGPIIDSIGDTGFEVTDHYAVLQNIDATSEFLAELEGKDSLTHVFVITNNVSAYQRIAQTLGDGIETVQLYESYLTNFQINAGRKG